MLSEWDLYLDDAAPSGRCLHRFQEDGVGVLAATGEDDTAPPATGHSGRDEVLRAVAAQPVSISITLRHVGKNWDGLETLGQKKN